MKNLKSLLKKTALALVFATSLGLSKQVDEEYFTKVKYIDERPNKDLFPDRQGKTDNSKSLSVSEKAFINGNFQALITYRDRNRDGKFDEVYYSLSKNDFITICEEIRRNPEKSSEIYEYYSYLFKSIKGNIFYHYERNKKIENKNFNEIDYETQKRITEILDRDVTKQSLTEFLEKEFKEKSDWANPNSPNTLYNKIKKAYENPGALDAIDIKKDTEIEKISDYWPEITEYCEEYIDDKPIYYEVNAKKNKTLLILAQYQIEDHCQEDIKKYGFKEKIYSDNEIMRFTYGSKGPEIILETMDLDKERKNAYYKRKYYYIDKKGEAFEIKDHPDAIFNYYEPLDHFAPEDLQRMKEFSRSAESESLLKSFIKKEYLKKGF